MTGFFFFFAQQVHIRLIKSESKNIVHCYKRFIFEMHAVLSIFLFIKDY